MAKFRFTIDVEPQDIPNLDDSHKRDCADVLNSVINSAFKYTLIFALGTLAFFGAFSLFSFTFYMRMGTLLPQLPVLMPILGFAILLTAFIAGTMNKPAIIIEMLFCAALAAVSLTSIPCIIVIPFAAYGVIVNLKLLTLIPIHRAISSEPGYPEFTPLPTKEEIAASKKKDK